MYLFGALPTKTPSAVAVGVSVADCAGVGVGVAVADGVAVAEAVALDFGDAEADALGFGDAEADALPVQNPKFTYRSLTIHLSLAPMKPWSRTICTWTTTT
jgi:hypothetical protein